MEAQRGFLVWSLPSSGVMPPGHDTNVRRLKGFCKAPLQPLTSPARYETPASVQLDTNTSPFYPQTLHLLVIDSSSWGGEAWLYPCNQNGGFLERGSDVLEPNPKRVE